MLGTMLKLSYCRIEQIVPVVRQVLHAITGALIVLAQGRGSTVVFDTMACDRWLYSEAGIQLRQNIYCNCMR